jgi:hypothetical protein
MPFAEGVSEVLSAMSKEWLSEEELAEPVEEPEEWTPEVRHLAESLGCRQWLIFCVWGCGGVTVCEELAEPVEEPEE